MNRTANTSQELPPIKHRNGANCWEIIYAIYEHRRRWPKWSPNYRPTARWDIEATLVAELHHAQRRNKSYHGYQNATLEPAMLPREVAAVRALNALHHYSACTRQVRDQIKTIRSQQRAANDTTQSEKYRLCWSYMLAASIDSLGTMRRRRARDWRRFQELLAVYRASVRVK